jgi:hypothetical protein
LVLTAGRCAREQLARLPNALLALEKAAERYPVMISPALQDYQQETQQRFAEQEEE